MVRGDDNKNSLQAEDIEKLNVNEISWFVTDHISAMLAYWDNNLVCRFANNAYLEWFGKTPEEMIGKITLKELLGPLYEKNLPYIQKALEGEKQIFEREIPLPNGGSRHSIATYIPDVSDGMVRGFFVHVADVTPIKLLENMLRENEKTKKREVLRSIIETREKERESIASELRENINQTLVFCKMMLQNRNNAEPGNQFLIQIANYIHLAIHQLNSMSNELSPTLIGHFGLRSELENYFSNFQKQYNRVVLFSATDHELEKMPAFDKISVFRIIQNYFALLVSDPRCIKISVNVRYEHPLLSIHFSHNNLSFALNRQSNEYNDIEIRTEYYDGTILETISGGESRMDVVLKIR